MTEHRLTAFQFDRKQRKEKFDRYEFAEAYAAHVSGALESELKSWRINAKNLKRSVGLNENCTQAEYVWTIDKLLKAEKDKERVSAKLEIAKGMLQTLSDSGEILDAQLAREALDRIENGE